jgi:hypothetical protein
MLLGERVYTWLQHEIIVIATWWRPRFHGGWRSWLWSRCGAWSSVEAPWKYKGGVVLLGLTVSVEARHQPYSEALDTLDHLRPRCYGKRRGGK